MKNHYIVTKIGEKIIDDSRDSTGEMMTLKEANAWIEAFTIDGIIKENGIVYKFLACQDS